jgi:uncharacterized membrane protein
MLKKIIFLASFLITCGFPTWIGAATLHSDFQGTLPARVVEIVGERTETLSGLGITRTVQELVVEFYSLPEKLRATVENDYVPVSVGATVYIDRLVEIDGRELFVFNSPKRTTPLIFFSIVLLVCIIIFGGWQGIRGLLSLIGGLFVILYILIPNITAGVPPLPLSLFVSSLIIIIGSYLTHGFTRTTTSAVLGMIVTVCITGGIAWWGVEWASLIGFSSDEATYININSRGSIDLKGILLGGILIGLLGVLYDAAIGQAVSVEELGALAPTIPRATIYRRVLRIGREHIGALVNTLAIAYVGTSLPLLILLVDSTQSLSVILSREEFTTEIIRTLAGSIGLVLAVPITTYLSGLILLNKSGGLRKGITSSYALDEKHHSHHH